MTDTNLDQVNLVDENDQIIGVLDKLEAHRGNALLHQAISLFLFHKKTDRSMELLLQQRSDKKIVGALQWANTLCANVRPKETHQECLLRRAREELGIDWQNSWNLQEVDVFKYQVICNSKFSEHELDHIFVTVLDDHDFKELKLKLNPDEVKNIAWIDWQKVKKQNLDNREITPWFKIFLENSNLIKKIEESF